MMSETSPNRLGRVIVGAAMVAIIVSVMLLTDSMPGAQAQRGGSPRAAAGAILYRVASLSACRW